MNQHRLIRALLREPVDCTPIWLMRQAGRYLPEYRDLRVRAGSFLALAKQPELACEVSLQPLRRFDLDAAIIFSDILMIPDAMGLGLDFVSGEGPVFHHPLTSARDIRRLGVPCPETDLAYVLDAIRLLKQALQGRTPIIGFCGSPWTIACYMLEGRGGRPFSRIQQLLAQDPASLRLLLQKLSEAIQLHLNAQIAAGADCVMIFDTWGSLLSPGDYQEFGLPSIAHIIEGLIRIHQQQIVPRIVFAKSCSHAHATLAEIGCDAIGLDEHSDLGQVRAEFGHKLALQGHLAPDALYLSDEELVTAAQQVLTQFGSGSGHVFNLGHGVRPDVDPEKVRLLVDSVHQFSKNKK